MSESNHSSGDQQTERERIVGRMQQEEAIQREYGTALNAKYGKPDNGASGKDSQRKPWRSSQVWKGIGLVVLLHLLLMFIPTAYVIVGLLQWLYVIPVLLKYKRDPGLVQGIWIAAGGTFVLNAVWLVIALGAFG